MLVPEQRLTLSAIGSQGYGKSTAMGGIVKILLDSGQFPRGAFLYCNPLKVEDTVPKYPSEVHYVQGRTLPMSHARFYKNSIIIAEDAPRLDLRSQKTVQEMVSWLARNNQNFLIVVTQRYHKDFDTVLRVFFKWIKGGFFYRIFEDKASTEFMDWTTQSQPDISSIIDAIQNGVESRISNAVRGKAGRPTDENSMNARCVKLFEEGKSGAEVARIFGFLSQSMDYMKVYSYWMRWKRRKHKKKLIEG